MDAPKTKRGGKRKGAGRPRLIPDEPMEHITLTVTARTRRLLSALGKGNASEGARKAAEVAYERYQKTYDK